MNRSIFFAVPCLLLFAACDHNAPVEEGNKKFALSDTMQHMIAVDTVRRCNIADELSLSGVVGFNENGVVKIFPRSSGQELARPAVLPRRGN